MSRKIAFYVMNSKGLYVLKQFLKTYGTNQVEFIVSQKDANVLGESFDEIKLLAKSNGITFYDRNSLCSAIESEFSGYKFAIGWRWLIKDSRNLVVFHDSILPQYRGFAPLVNSLINGERKLGVTALMAHENYDEGPILGQKSIDVVYPITIEEAIKVVEPLYSLLVNDIFSTIIEGVELNGVEQSNKRATFSLWLDDKDYFIDWNWSAEKIRRFVDAVGYPFDGAKALVNGRTVRILEVNETSDVIIEHRERHIGKVIFSREYPVVVCGEGLLSIVSIKDENCNPLSVNFRTRFE